MSSGRKHPLSQYAQTKGGLAWLEQAEGLDAIADGEDELHEADVCNKFTCVCDAPVDEAQRIATEVQRAIALIQEKCSTKGAGEVLLTLGGDRASVSGSLSHQGLLDLVERLEHAADKVGADATVLEATWGEISRGQHGVPRHVLIRRRANTVPVDGACVSSSAGAMELRVAVIGNVDSGKSTMVGVLTRAQLDDGRGAARAKVFKHAHEGASGRTSAIGQHNLCFSSSGQVLNDASFKTSTCAGYVVRAAKIVTLVDLAGHERYFKTTAYGLTGHLPDYACLLVGANAGIVGMCKEHLGVALALKVPVFFVVTKIDLCPEHILKQSLAQLSAVLKRPGVKKRPFLVKSAEDAVTCARSITSDSLAPIFLTSAVSGSGLWPLRLFLNLLPQRTPWAARRAEPAEFIIDETFSVPGVGTVVAGTLKRGTLRLGTPLLLGPDIADGSFHRVAVKSIHYKRMPVSEVVAGQTAALALKKTRRERVRKGMVLAHEALSPSASWEFDAEIAILTHATTIQPRYQAVVHCEIIRQAAQVVAMDQERLRSGDRATVRFRFLQRPEYITAGMRFVFREGRTKGIGLIVAPRKGEGAAEE